MDVRAGLQEYWKGLTPTQKEARLENQWKGARDAKKKAYAADAPARAARNEARAAEEQARAEARAEAERRAAAERRAEAERRAAAERRAEAERLAAAQAERRRANAASIARFQDAIQRPASSAGPYQGRSTMVDLAVMPQQHASRELDLRTEIFNFASTRGSNGRGPPHCGMCGAFNKGPLAPANVEGVVIKKQMKQVCQCCKGATWKHVATGSYFRFCMVCKKFHDIHKFAQGDDEKVRSDFDPFTTAKCADAREKSRAAYQNKKQRLEK